MWKKKYIDCGQCPTAFTTTKKIVARGSGLSLLRVRVPVHLNLFPCLGSSEPWSIHCRSHQGRKKLLDQPLIARPRIEREIPTQTVESDTKQYLQVRTIRHRAVSTSPLIQIGQLLFLRRDRNMNVVQWKFDDLNVKKRPRR